MTATAPQPAAACPVIDHLACKLPGDLEPRFYDVFVDTGTVTAGLYLPNQSVDIGNRDAPWHWTGFGFHRFSGTGTLKVQIYNSQGTGIVQAPLNQIPTVIRIEHLAGGVDAAFPENPSYVWPVNSSLVFDVQVLGANSRFFLFFYGFKLYDRGKAPC